MIRKSNYDIELLQSYYMDRKLKYNTHKTHPLMIWNYHDRVQCTPELWDDVTLNCRALVTDFNGNVVACSFPKFFNMEEMKIDLDDDYQIFEKLDGSLGILFHYNNEWIFASRGSFDGEHAEMGMDILEEKYPQYKELNTKYTYVFEIIYPENRIVVNYGSESKLVYLSQYDTRGIEYMNIESMKSLGFDVVEQYIARGSFKEFKEANTPNKEGYVVRFNNGTRMKIKFEDYIQLHKIRFNVNLKLVIKTFKDDSYDKSIEIIPDEHLEWFLKTYIAISKRYAELKQDCYLLYAKYYNESECIKDFALAIQDLDSSLKAILFMLYKNRGNILDYRIKHIIIDRLIKEEYFEEYHNYKNNQIIFDSLIK